MSMNLVVLVILLLDGENFLIREEEVFMPVLGMPLLLLSIAFPSKHE
jgi:hypothetical protein